MMLGISFPGGVIKGGGKHKSHRAQSFFLNHKIYHDNTMRERKKEPRWDHIE